MIVYRIERKKYLNATLSGIGASMAKGFRWNSQFIPLVYTAESRALAMLEVAVHLDLSQDLPTDRFFVEIEIPDTIKIIELKIADLPRGWDSKPPTSVTQHIGDDFVTTQKAAVLKVPSSIVPEECNYLINPQHPEAKKIKVIRTMPMAFDARL